MASEPVTARSKEKHQGVSVVVVSYNTKAELEITLSRIEPNHEVIVVDNASSDGSPQMVREKFPNATLIEARSNIGFGPANNLGMRVATRPLTLLLNSDCYAQAGAIDALATVFEDESVIAAGGALFHEDGRIQNSASHMLELYHVLLEQTMLEKVLGGYWVQPPLDTPSEVGQVMGACLMLRTGSIEFDETFFLYCEDTELLFRLKKNNTGKILYVPSAMFTHVLGASSKGTNRWLAVARYNRGKELYFALHHGLFSAWICLLLDRFGALFRLAIWSGASILTLFLVRRFSDQIGLWANVLTAPRLGPPRQIRIEP